MPRSITSLATTGPATLVAVATHQRDQRPSSARRPVRAGEPAERARAAVPGALAGASSRQPSSARAAGGPPLVDRRVAVQVDERAVDQAVAVDLRGRRRSTRSARRGCPRATIRPRSSTTTRSASEIVLRPVGDDQRRSALHHLAQRQLDPGLGGRVDRRGGVVEDQDARVHRAARGRSRSAAAGRPRASGRARRRASRSRPGRSQMNSCAWAWRAAWTISSGVASGRAVGDVLGHGGREQERVLADDADVAAQRVERDVADVGAVDA